MLNPILYPRQMGPGATPDSARERAKAKVSNGVVKVGDFVRELPANHLQPCACCLCRPPGGERPPLLIMAIIERDGTTYLRLDQDYECPAEELERVTFN